MVEVLARKHLNLPDMFVSMACSTFTIGQAAGAQGTIKINNWTQHLTWILDVPDSPIPTTSIDLLWAALPAYRSGRATSSSAAGQIDGKLGNASAKLSANADLSASNVTASEPEHPVDPEEIPVVCVGNFFVLSFFARKLFGCSVIGALPASNVTASEPEHRADPEEIPVVRC